MSTTQPLTWTYRKGSTLPSRTIAWYDGPEPNATLVSFGATAPHTWQLTITRSENGAAVVPVKTTGITGADTSPNVTIDWASGDLGALDVGEYWVTLKATRTSDSKTRFLPRKVRLVIEAVPT